MAFVTFVRANPALAPLFLFCGAGCAAAVGYPRKITIPAFHLLRTHPEIQIDKKNNPYPWQHIQQHQNVKFINAAPEFYESRRNMKTNSF